MDEVILVNEQDEALGTMEKMAAHKKLVLHRAFSVFLFNDKDELLLQRRAHEKYHSGGLWTNTCCSHPRPGEPTIEAAKRRLKEEMGIDTELQPAFSFVYQAAFENGLYEYEFDHVYTGRYNGAVVPNEKEVAGSAYQSLAWLKTDLALHPEKYTEWFKIAFPKLEAYLFHQVPEKD